MKRNNPHEEITQRETLRSRNLYGIILTAVIIAVVVVLNTVIFGLARKNSWYFYTSRPLQHTIGTGTDDYVREVADRGEVRILFCDTPENLEGEQAFNLVWQTAHQFAERHSDFVSVETVNIFTDPASVEHYKYETDDEGNFVLDEDGKRKKINEVNRNSVIFAGENDFAVLPMQSFFILDEEKVIVSYTGEEVTAAMIHRVQTPETRPTAYFTTAHGESYSESFMNRLVCAGYAINTVDFVSQDLTYRDGDIIIISNPQYDFTRGREGVIGELDEMDAFLEAGGSVFAMLDPVVTNTVKLEEFLSSWGLTVMRAETSASAHDTVMVHDSANSITTDGYALITEISREGVGAEIADAMEAAGAGRIIISRASPITVASPTGKTAIPLLTSSSSSTASADGQVVDEDGNYAVAAMSRDEATGGGVFVVSSVYLIAEDALATNEYGNRDLIFFVIGELCDVSVPTGGTHLLFDETTVEDLTMWEARFFTVILCVMIPLGVVIAGTVILIKRRNR